VLNPRDGLVPTVTGISKKQQGKGGGRKGAGNEAYSHLVGQRRTLIISKVTLHASNTGRSHRNKADTSQTEHGHKSPTRHTPTLSEKKKRQETKTNRFEIFPPPKGRPEKNGGQRVLLSEGQLGVPNNKDKSINGNFVTFSEVKKLATRGDRENGEELSQSTGRVGNPILGGRYNTNACRKQETIFLEGPRWIRVLSLRPNLWKRIGGTAPNELKQLRESPLGDLQIKSHRSQTEEPDICPLAYRPFFLTKRRGKKDP